MAVQELKVLLIEDNPGDAFLIKFYLGESTTPVFQVSHAETVAAALELLAQNKYDIILSDMNLPDSFGTDTIKTVLGKFPGNLVVVLTGLTDEEVGLETVRFGAQDFLVKGKFDSKVLISSVMFAFERFKLNSQIDKVSKDLDNENSRFNSVLRLLKLEYVELDTAKSEDFLNTSGIEEADTLKKIIAEVIATGNSGEFRYKRKDNGQEYRLLYERNNGKFCGIVQKLS